MSSTGAIGLVGAAACLRHDPGHGHPERRERLEAIAAHLRRTGLWTELERLEAGAAERAALERVHPRAYVEHVGREIEAGAGWVDSPDANVGPESFEAALRAAGGALAAVERVLDGRWRRAFVAVRPPGHHAEESLAMGFCLFNNVAIAARHAQALGVERVAIVDWDVHHGNGTQHLFEADPSVLYASLHQHPHYPGTGLARERGVGDGAGTTFNCPLPPGSGDREWLAAFEDVVLPAVEAFRPGLILVSAGFDAHLRDPLSSTRVHEETFGVMSAALAGVADSLCAGRVVSVLEGGYDLQGLSLSVAAHLEAWLG